MDTFADAQRAGVGATVALALPRGLHVVGVISEVDVATHTVKFRDGRAISFAPPAQEPATPAEGDAMAEEQKTIQQEIRDLAALVVEKLAALDAKVDALRSAAPAPLPVPEPAPSAAAPPEGLFRLIKPGLGEEPPGIGVQMTVADEEEVVARARFGVRWNGDVPLLPAELEERWGIIERLKKRDPEVLPFYRMLDPLFCGVGLLTNLFAPHTADALSFGVTEAGRESMAGQTVQGFIESMLSITGRPSGD